MDERTTATEYRACKSTGLWTLSWAVTLLEEKGLKIKAVTLRKYAEQGRLGRKLAGSWLVTMPELDALAALPAETRRPGRPRKS